MRWTLIAASLLLFPASAALADTRIGISVSTPEFSIGINMPSYPQLVRIPGYPVYYDPHVEWNYFFYDGLYWVFHDDDWYVSSWYNGPWRVVDSYAVPVYLLRVPVRYYRKPPPYFHGWRHDAPPRWEEHWGRDWAKRRDGWDHWDRRAVPPPAPLPKYQRNYNGDRYPSNIEQQRTIRNERYRYQPRDPAARDYYRRDAAPKGAPQGNGRGNRNEGNGHGHGHDRN